MQQYYEQKSRKIRSAASSMAIAKQLANELHGVSLGIHSLNLRTRLTDEQEESFTDPSPPATYKERHGFVLKTPTDELTTFEQICEDPTAWLGNASRFYGPRRIRLRTKRAKRCLECKSVLVKPDAKAQSIRFTSKSFAM